MSIWSFYSSIFKYVQLLVEPVAADPTALEDQLNRVKALNNELMSQSRLIDSAKQVN